MTFKYKRNHLRQHLIFSILWFSLGMAGIFMTDQFYWPGFIFIVFALFYLGMYLYKRKNHYLSLENDFIKIHRPFVKPLPIKEITGIDYHAEDYILKTEEKNLTINTAIITSDSRSQLRKELKKIPPNTQ